MSSINTYVKFLQLAETANEVFEWIGEIDQTAMRLLEIIATMHSNEIMLSFEQVNNLTSVASTSSIRRKLIRLFELGLIDFFYLDNILREKYLYPTSKAEEYFSFLGQCLYKAAKEDSH